MMYHIDGHEAEVDGHRLRAKHGMELDATVPTTVRAPDASVRVLVLQGRPIDEPVVQHGPFVMNTREEIYQAFADFQRTEFGGWPWGHPMSFTLESKAALRAWATVVLSIHKTHESTPMGALTRIPWLTGAPLGHRPHVQVPPS